MSKLEVIPSSVRSLAVPDTLNTASADVVSIFPIGITFLLQRIEEVYRQSFERFFFVYFNHIRVLGYDTQSNKYIVGLEKCAVCLTAIHSVGESFSSDYRFTCNSDRCRESLGSYFGIREDLEHFSNRAHDYIRLSCQQN